MAEKPYKPIQIYYGIVVINTISYTYSYLYKHDSFFSTKKFVHIIWINWMYKKPVIDGATQS
jgi:hypothetical protein